MAFVVCSGCGKSIPEANLDLHTLRCQGRAPAVQNDSIAVQALPHEENTANEEVFEQHAESILLPDVNPLNADLPVSMSIPQQYSSSAGYRESESEDVTAQMLADEEFARRLEQEEQAALQHLVSVTASSSASSWEQPTSMDHGRANSHDVAAQLLADEEFARQLAQEEHGLQQQVGTGPVVEAPVHSSSGLANARGDAVSHAMELLAPLRALQQHHGMSQHADTIDAIFHQLQSHLANSAMLSSDSSDIADTSDDSDLPLVLPPQVAPPQTPQPLSSIVPLSDTSAIISDVVEVRGVESASSSSGAASSSGTAASSDTRTRNRQRFAEYMANVEARRQEARRRRDEFLAQMDLVMERHSITLGAAAVPPPADAAFVEANTSTSVWEGPDDTQCVICVQDLAHGDQVRTLPCGHVYHQECIDTWLRRSRLCCLCKNPIDGAPGSRL